LTVSTKKKTTTEKEETKMLGGLFPLSEIDAMNDFVEKNKVKKTEILREGSKLFMAVKEALTSEKTLSGSDIIDKISEGTGLSRSEIIDQVNDLRADINRNASRVISHDEAIITLAESLSVPIKARSSLSISKTPAEIVSQYEGTSYQMMIYLLKELLPFLESCQNSNACKQCPMNDECHELQQIISSMTTYHDQILEYKSKSLEDLVADGIPVTRLVRVLKLIIPEQKGEEK